MARIVIATKGPYREVLVIDSAVGAGAPNSRDDVMAVQYLLKVAMLDGPASPGFKPEGEKPIEVDGGYGRQTQAYISFFQTEVNKRQNRKLIEPDGRVDPVRDGSPNSSITHTFYTIVALNAALRTRRGDSFRLENDSLMPAALKKKLFIDF